MVNAYVRTYRLTNEIAGFLIAIEFLGIMLAGLYFSPRIVRISVRKLAIFGMLVAALANISILFWHGALEGLFILRLVAGIGAGCGLCASNAALSALKKPIFGAGLMGALTIILGTLIFVFEQALAGIAGPTVIFLIAAAIAAVGLLSAPALPVVRRNIPVAHLSLTSGPSAALLASYGLSFAATYALWPFAVRLGTSNGIALSDVNLALGVSAIASLIGPALAAALGERKDHRRLLLLAMATTGAATVGMMMAESFYAFMLAAVFLNIAIAFSAIEFLDLLARLDRSGRLASSSSVINAFGNAAGPAIGSVAMGLGGYAALGVVSIVGLALAMAAMLFAQTVVDDVLPDTLFD